MRRWLRVFILLVFAFGGSWTPAQDLDLEEDLLDLDENYGKERKRKGGDDFGEDESGEDEFSLEEEPPAPKPKAARPRSKPRPKPRPKPQPKQEDDFGLGEEDPFAEFEEEKNLEASPRSARPAPKSAPTRESDLDLNDESAGAAEDPFADFEEPVDDPADEPVDEPKAKPQRQTRKTRARPQRQRVDEVDELDEFSDKPAGESFEDEPFERYDKPRRSKTRKSKSRSGRRSRNDFDFPDNKPFRYFVGGGYHMATKTNFSGGTVTEGSLGGFDNFSVQVSHSSALEVSGGIISNRPRALGFKANLTYQLNRGVSGAEFSSPDGLTEADLSGTNLQLILVEGGGIYRWSDLYVLLSLNYPIVSYTGENPTTGGEIKMSGSINWSFGVGYRINREWTAELQLKQISVKATDTSDTVTLDYGKGSLSGFAAGVLYLF